MNNKTTCIIEFGFCIINYEELVWRSRRVLSVEAVTPSLTSIIFHIRYKSQIH